MKKFARWTVRALVVMALVGLVAVVPWFLQREAFFRIESTEVSLIEGEKLPDWLTNEWDMTIKDVRKFEGQDLWHLKLDTVMAAMRARPWVRDVQVTRSWPNKLIVELQPKNLAAYLRGEKGSLRPVLEDAAVMEADQISSFVNLPLLTGGFNEKNTLRLREAISLIHSLPKEGVLSLDRISEIGYHDKEGFWFIVQPFGTKIRFGVGDIDRKLSRVRQVMEYLDSRQIGARVIDADLSKKVVVRLRKSP